ncbi:MAG: helix-turn-helix transcriptional regulator [Verrucomicrobiota bacterium]
MKALANIASLIVNRLQENDCFDPTTGDFQDLETAQEILNLHPVWLICYNASLLRAVFINDNMAQSLGSEPGFIKPENEYHTIHYCEAGTSLYRLQVLDHFNRGETSSKQNIASIIDPQEESSLHHDFATPLSFHESGRTCIYAHIYSPMQTLTLANAYAFCNPDFLTHRQREVFSLLLEGLPKATIASKLEITTRTLEKHISAILELTGHSHPKALIKTCLDYL